MGVALVVAILILLLGVIAEVVIPVALAALLGAVAAACVAGVSSQSAEIQSVLDEAVRTLADETGIDTDIIQDVRTAVNESSALAALGSVTQLVSGVNSLIGLASGILLGALVFYYLVKDGAVLRGRLVGIVEPVQRVGLEEFIGDSCAALRSYGRGRTVMSAIVSSVIGLAAILLGLPLIPSILLLTFIGGYIPYVIPYVGAFLAGAYVALIALGERGIGAAVVMVIVSLAANLVLENFVEPKVMGRSLELHPIVVLVVLALGGMLGGIIGLLVAVPAAAVARSAFLQLRSARIRR